MELNGWGIDTPLLSIDDKRHVSVDGDGPDRDSKKLCTQPLESSYGNGTTVASSHLPPPWVTQNGTLHYGSLNELQQSTIDIYSPHLSKPQDDPGEMLWPDMLQTIPISDPVLMDSHQIVPFQSGELDRSSLNFGSGSGIFIGSQSENGTPTDVSPLPSVDWADLGISSLHSGYSSGTFDSYIGHGLNNVSQREDEPPAGLFLPPIKECVHDLINSTTLVNEFQLSLDVAPVKSQIAEGDGIVQVAPISITNLEQSQSSSAIALESVSLAVKNDGISSGKLIRSSLRASR